MNAIDYISHHPVIALGVGLCHIMGAYVIGTMELPIVVMQSFQLGAWAVTITVGLITIYGFCKKNK